MNNSELYRQYLDSAASLCNSYGMVEETQEDADHIIDIAASIMMTRDIENYKGGSFVNAVVNNDLTNAVSRADSVCIRNLKLFTYIKNFGYNLHNAAYIK